MTARKMTVEQHLAETAEARERNARLRDRPRQTRKSIERHIVEPVIAKYGDGSPEAASARRTAKSFTHLRKSDVSALPLPAIERALADAAKTYRRVTMWVAQFYTRRGRPPPLTLLRGGLYEEKLFDNNGLDPHDLTTPFIFSDDVDEVTTEP